MMPNIGDAQAIVERLQSWLDCSENCSIPTVYIEWSVFTIRLLIGQTPVWSSEEDDVSDLTLGYCKNQWKFYVDGLVASTKG